jgi:hypothetical protein
MARKPTPADMLMVENARARSIGRGRRSPLYLWLRDHHDQLAESFVRTAPAWGSIAAHLANMGLVGGWGDPPAPETVRKAWYLVRRDMARSRAARVAPVAGAPTHGGGGILWAEADPTTGSPEPHAPVHPPPEEAAPSERRFRMSRLRSAPAASVGRNDPVAICPTVGQPPEEPTARIDPEEILARLFRDEPPPRFPSVDQKEE